MNEIKCVCEHHGRKIYFYCSGKNNLFRVWTVEDDEKKDTFTSQADYKMSDMKTFFRKIKIVTNPKEVTCDMIKNLCQRVDEQSGNTYPLKSYVNRQGKKDELWNICIDIPHLKNNEEEEEEEDDDSSLNGDVILEKKHTNTGKLDFTRRPPEQPRNIERQASRTSRIRRPPEQPNRTRQSNQSNQVALDRRQMQNLPTILNLKKRLIDNDQGVQLDTRISYESTTPRKNKRVKYTQPPFQKEEEEDVLLDN